MSDQAIVEAIDLTKHYNRFVAVDHLNLCVGEGEVYGFLGPNGAGKTTTILMLLGLTEPTSGTPRVCGYNSTRDPLQVKRLAGYLPEKVGFYEDLTTKQNLQYTARLNGISHKRARILIEQALRLVDLADVADHQVGTFSRGMKQRLGLADVLVKEPKVVFLDEPTSGIDPEGVSQLLDMIVNMAKEQNITMVVSSHQLPYVQKICNRVGIMSRGHLVAEGPIDHLGREILGGGRFQVEAQISEPSSSLIESIRLVQGVVGVESAEDRLLIACESDLRSQIAQAIINSGSLLLQMKIHEYGLEEIYMKYFREEER